MTTTFYISDAQRPIRRQPDASTHLGEFSVASNDAARSLSYLSLSLGGLVGGIAVALSTLDAHHQHTLMYGALISPAVSALFFGRRWLRDAATVQRLRAQIGLRAA